MGPQTDSHNHLISSLTIHTKQLLRNQFNSVLFQDKSRKQFNKIVWIKITTFFKRCASIIL